MIRRRIGRVVGVAAGIAVLSGLLVLPASADLDLEAGDSAAVAYSSGEGVNVRTAPSAEAGVFTTLPEGWVVTIAAGPQTDADGAAWYEIATETELGAISGWVSADYLGHLDSVAAGQSALSAAATAYVSAGGEGLNLREGPSLDATIIFGIPDGAAVSVLTPGIVDEQGIAWSMVSYNGAVGYSAALFLVDLPATTELQTVEPESFGTLSSSATAFVSGTGGDGLMLRAAPTSQAGAVSAIFEGVQIELLDGPVVDEDGVTWYMTTIEGITGWVHGAYLSTDVAAPVAQALTLGDLFINESLLYLGTPYVWAGSEPGGFDCSGFTYYIINTVAGNGFPRAIEEQIVSGVYVPYEELMPGDLVFFENTYTEGLSHVGFYLGNGQFISATGEFDAVGISDLNDPYWSTRYLTARRLS